MAGLEAALADSIVQAGQVAGAATPRVRGADWRLAEVTAVRADGTVDCGAIRARRLESYPDPAIGDVAVVARSGAGAWIAHGRLDTGTGAWADYTPAWGASSSTPTVGNGQLAGRWTRAGRRVDYQIYLELGSTSNRGSGFYSFSLPVGAAAALPGVIGGTARLMDASPATAYTAVGRIGAGEDIVSFFANSTAGGSISSTNPFTWTSGDSMLISGTYEAAT